MAFEKHPLILSMPTRKSQYQDWVQWHKDLKSRFGKRLANSLWVRAWSKRKSDDANTSQLREYLEKNGIKIEAGIFGGIVDAGKGVADFFGGIFKMGKYVSIAVVVIVLGGVALILFNIGRKPIEALREGAKFTAAGKAGAAAKAIK